MKSITKSSRINNALQVIQYLNSGMTVVEACRAVGIPRSSYYDIMSKNPEAIAEIRAIIDANNREQLGLILSRRNEILKKIILEGLAEDTAPRDRLAIFKALNELDKDLTNKIETESQMESNALDFLKHGPITRLQESRFSTTQTIISIESGS